MMTPLLVFGEMLGSEKTYLSVSQLCYGYFFERVFGFWIKDLWFSGGFISCEIEFQSGSNSSRFCWDHRGLNYICLHESGLSCNSFRIEFIPFFIPDWTLDSEWNADSESCKLGSKFHSGMKLGMKSTW